MSDEVVETPFGKFLVNPNDCVGTTLKAGTLWDGPGFLQVIAKEYARFGEVGTTVIDVGANIGSFSVYCCRMGAWRVVAVEPVRRTHEMLLANLDLNKDSLLTEGCYLPGCATSLVRILAAAYDERTALVMPVFDPDNLGATALVPCDEDGPELPNEIPALPLDEFDWIFGARVSLIKIDAQGCDGAVLRGLEQTIRTHHPAIVFEWENKLAEPHGYTLPETLVWLVDLGYQTHAWPTHPNNFLAIWKRPVD